MNYIAEKLIVMVFTEALINYIPKRGKDPKDEVGFEPLTSGLQRRHVNHLTKGAGSMD